MLEEDSNVSDSTVLLDDYQHNPDKIAAKRRKLAAKYIVGAPVNSENAAPDNDNDTNNIQTDSANSNSANIMGENNRPEYQQWRVNKYFNSMDNAQKANEDDSSEDLKIKRELLKQETSSNQSEDINEQNLNNHIEYDSNEEDDGVIVIEDSDDDCVAYETRENNQVANSQASSDLLSGRYVDKFSNVSRTDPKPSAINARRATFNHYENNETPLNLTKIQCNQPRLRVLLPATINARRATIDISELGENRRIETDINERNNNETEDSRENKTVKQREPGDNISPVVSETSDVTNETNIVIEDSQSNDETCLKQIHPSKCDMKTDRDIITDTSAVDKGNKRVIFNPELTLSHWNNNNVITQRTPYKHKAKTVKVDKKKQIDCDENTTVNTTNDENLCNIGVDSSAQLTHRSDLNSSFKNTNTREVVHIYINANEISRKRLSIDITSEDKTKRICNSTGQSNNVERNENTDTNETSEKEDIQMDTNDGPVIDESNKDESNNEANNQSVIDTNVGNSKEALSSGEFESLIKFQVDFCTYLRGNVLNHSKIHRNDVKVKSYLKSAESLTNEIERLKALAYDRRVKADIQYVCPVCTCISTYSASHLFRNNDNHTNVETNGIKCEFCRGTGTLYNSYMKKFLQDDNARRNRSKVESYVNNNNPVEEVPGTESLNHSKESNNTVDSVPETDTLDTCEEKQYNNSKLGSVTSSEAIVESKKLAESQCNLNSKQRNITSSIETNTSIDSLKVVSPRERSVLNVTKDNIEDSKSSDKSLTKSTNSAIVRNTDVPDTLIEPLVDKNNKISNNKQESIEKEANNTFEKSPCEVTSSNIVSATVNSENENLGMIDNFDSDRFSNETNKVQSTTNVDTRTNVTYNRLLNSEINDSICTENLATEDGTVISKFFCKMKNDSNKIGSTNLKRKINDQGLKMFFKRKRVTENRDCNETSSHKEVVNGQNSSNSPEDCNESNTCDNIGDRRSHTQNNNTKPNELSLNETTKTHTEEQNINDPSNKSSDSRQQTVENNEKYSKSKDKTRGNLETSETDKSNKLNKKPILKHRENQRLPSNHEHNDTEYDADTEDQNIGITSTMTDGDIKNRLRVRGVNKNGESINNVNKEQLESRNEKEKTKTSEGFNVSDKRRQDGIDKSRCINETNRENDREMRTADSEDEENENSTIDSDASGDESNNTLRKTLEDSFKKIKKNLNMTAPPAPHVTISNENPHKDCEKKVSNRNKLDIKCQIQYMCNICTCVFVYGGRFLRHMIENHNMDLKKIPKQCIARKCSFCRVFLKENAINLHVQKFHSDEYLKHGDAIKSKKKTKAIKQKNVVKDVNKVRWITKDGNWRYVCSICNVTINSEHAARKHKKDKHPNMKNRKLYDKVSIEEIHASNVEAHKTSGDRGPKNTKIDTDEIGSDSEHDTNEDCENSEDGSWEHETDDGTDNYQNTSNHDSNSEDNCEQSPRGSSFEDKDDSCGDDIDAEWDKSSGSESNPPQINGNDQDNMQEILELSDDEDRGPTNKDNSDRSSSSDDDIEYNRHRSEDGSSEHETDDDTDKKNTKAIKQKNVVKDVNKVRWITKDGNWRYVCSICNVTINSEYAARKHKKDKHPNMKNRKLYDKVSIEEIHASNVEEAHKTSVGDHGLKNTKNDTDEIGRDSEHDPNEVCEDASWNDETDNDQNTSNHGSNSEVNCEQSSISSGFEDKDESFDDDTDAECDKSSGAESNPPQINENDQDNMQEILELSDDEDNGTTNKDDSDWRSCSDDDMEYDTGHSKEEASSDEGEINSHDLGHESCGRTKLRVNDINAPHVVKKQTAANIQKVKYYFECIICEVKLDSHYAVRKHRKEKHPDLKKKKLVYKIFKSEYGESNVEKNDERLDYEKEQTTRDEYRIDLNSCSGYTDENNSDSEYDFDELSDEERNVIIESGQRRNIDSVPEVSKKDDTQSDENNEINNEQDIANTNLSGEDYTGVSKKCYEKGETINEDYHEISGNNLRLDNIGKKSKRKNLLYTYECTACKVTLDSEYAVRKHRKDKHRNERKKKLIRKFLTVVKNQQNIVQSNDEKIQRTNVDNMRGEENISNKTGNENINNNNMDNRNDVNTSRFDEVPEQCNDSRHKINEKSHNPSINDHIEDNLKNDRSENHTTDGFSENATTASQSDHETFIEDRMRLIKNVDKNFDQDKNIINSINNQKNPSAHNAHKCILCKEYFQSFHFMRIHRESKHPFMNNVKIFEKVVITNFAKEENSAKDVECRVEEASKVNHLTNEGSQNVTDISTVQKSTNASDDNGSKDSRENVITDEAVKTDENVQNAVGNVLEQAYARVHQNNNDMNNTDKSISNKNSSNLQDQENKSENKNANKNNQNHKENNGNSSDAKARYSNCYVCAINFDVNEQYDHICTSRKEKNVFYNCYACGVNFVNNIEHLCSKKHEAWIENIQISNVVTVKDSYVFSCVECKYSTDLYDDVVKHCQNHYLEIVDAVTYCGICQLNFDKHRYSTHHNLHAKFELINYSYKSLFSNFDVIFDDIPRDAATLLKAHSIYTTHSIRMAKAEEGPEEYSLYQCDQCKSCVPKPEIEKHCLSQCSEMNYICPVCDRAFLTYEMCVNHEFTHRNGAKIFRIIAFNRKDDRKFNLKLIEAREMTMKLPKSPIKAQNALTAELFMCQCDLCFICMENFKIHFLECNSSFQNGILCPKCPVKRIFLASELDRHLQLHHTEVIYEFVINQINIRRSIEPNEVKCDETTQHNEPDSTELNAEVQLKKALLKQEDDAIVISDDDD